MNIQISNKIGEILSTSKCNSYVITGYKWLETRLVLNFVDCKQVFDFKERGTTEYYLETFYTKNYLGDERFDELKFFEDVHDKEQPEFDKVNN